MLGSETVYTASEAAEAMKFFACLLSCLEIAIVFFLARRLGVGGAAIWAAALVVVSIAFLLWYREQIRWASQREQGIDAIPVRPLVHSPPPDKYVECAVGSLKMEIPPSLHFSFLRKTGESIPGNFISNRASNV